MYINNAKNYGASLSAPIEEETIEPPKEETPTPPVETPPPEPEQEPVKAPEEEQKKGICGPTVIVLLAMVVCCSCAGEHLLKRTNSHFHRGTNFIFLFVPFHAVSSSAS